MGVTQVTNDSASANVKQTSGSSNNQDPGASATQKFATIMQKANDGGPGSPGTPTPTPTAAPAGSATATTTMTMPPGTVTTATGASFNAATASAKGNDGVPTPSGTITTATGAQFNPNTASAKANEMGPSAPALPPGVQQPTNWNATGVDPNHPGSDPFNVVVIFKNPNASMSKLQNGLEQLQHPNGAAPAGRYGYPHWQTVGTGTSPWGVITHTQGTGAETANVQPYGQGKPVQQSFNMRVGGYDTEFGSGINHFRAYQQSSSTWFLAASRESFTGSYHSVDANGYDQGAQQLAADIVQAGKSQGWNPTQTTITTQNGGGWGSNDVHFNGNTIFITMG